MKTRILENKTAAKWIGVILIVFFCAIGIKSCYKSPAVYYPIAADAQEFHLKVDEETPTVEVNAGTHHRLWADKPYLAVSVQMDGSRITYSMPAGYETWNGAEPRGCLRLIGTESNTLVKIWKQ